MEEDLVADMAVGFDAEDTEDIIITTTVSGLNYSHSYYSHNPRIRDRERERAGDSNFNQIGGEELINYISKSLQTTMDIITTEDTTGDKS